MPPFESAMLKLKRAEGQTNRLGAEVDAFLNADNQAQGFTTYEKNDHREWRVVFRVFKPFPEMWPVQIGEIVHNLRSALDHVIFEASAPDAHGNPLPGIEFPIFLDETQYYLPIKNRQGGQYKIRGIKSTAARTLIETFQPFKFEDPPNHFLWTLQQLSNADKHRLLNVASGQIVETGIIWQPGEGVVAGVIEEMRGPSGLLVDGAEMFYIRTSRPFPNAQVNVNPQARSPILFDGPSPFIANRPVSEAISGAGRLIRAFIDEMREISEP